MSYKDPEKNRQCAKKHYWKNREEIRERKRQLRLEKKKREKARQHAKIYYLKNREKILARQRQYKLKNKEKINECQRQWHLERKRENPRKMSTTIQIEGQKGLSFEIKCTCCKKSLGYSKFSSAGIVCNSCMLRFADLIDLIASDEKKGG